MSGRDAGSVSIRLAWGAGSLATIFYLNVVTALVLVYLTTVVKLDAAVAGSLVAGARLIDAFSDPLMGWITDRTHTRWGQRRPYLLLGAVVCGVGLPLVYSIHLFGAGQKFFLFIIGNYCIVFS